MAETQKYDEMRGRMPIGKRAAWSPHPAKWGVSRKPKCHWRAECASCQAGENRRFYFPGGACRGNLWCPREEDRISRRHGTTGIRLRLWAWHWGANVKIQDSTVCSCPALRERFWAYNKISAGRAIPIASIGRSRMERQGVSAPGRVSILPRLFCLPISYQKFSKFFW